MKRFAFSKGRLIGLICALLLPAAAAVHGILMLSKDVVLDLGVAFTYFILSAITAGLLCLCIFFNCKTWKKTILSVVILALFLIIFFASFALTGWTRVKHYEGNEAVQRYSSIESKMLPELSEVGKTTNIEYHNVYSYVYIFFAETNHLVCQYTQEEYERQKEQLDHTYTFQTETIKDENSNCEPMVEIDGYQFKLLSFKEYGNYYPKDVVLIGCSDAAREIVYIEFNDPDLDYISSLREFIVDECGWKYVR